ncbi:hypothetical protein [Laribacter hongkongensis]|uniref:Uncharacterized protein n=1 Tax=Laribacter hongkongensis TaxID=168471 RepID=A0ABD4STE5_9NEIS|nr:hypothetical protein [Laribacter hongkongensis]MCG9027051.1 hypothetical protein [Laribacter hongkongensis]
MHYPVMTERQLAFRWKISLKTLRRWRAEDEGPTWHKFFQYVWGGDSFDTQRSRYKKPLKPNIGAGCSGFIA